MNSQVKYINHKDIDAEKWALCIENAENSRIYANIWHLDRTAIVWDALVYGDYKFVMPLPIRNKFGISYVYQPLFCQQLGIFPEPDTSITEEFQNALLFPYFCHIALPIQATLQTHKHTDLSPYHHQVALLA